LTILGSMFLVNGCRVFCTFFCIFGPIQWGHSGHLCHALSWLSLLLWTLMRRRRAQWRRATVAIPGEWQCKTGGVRRLAVANGPNIFQMLLVLNCILSYPSFCLFWRINLFICPLTPMDRTVQVVRDAASRKVDHIALHQVASDI